MYAGRKTHLWKHLITNINRKSMMFCIGATIALHETFVGQLERPFLLALAGALMGLPFVISADQKFSQGKEEGEKDAA